MRLMSLLGRFAALIDSIVFSHVDDRPIGLKAFCDYSDEELLNQLAKPIMPPPALKPNIPKKALSKVAPAFAHAQPSSYSFQEYKNPFQAQMKAQRFIG